MNINIQNIIEQGEGIRVETKNANKPYYYGQLFPDKFQPFPKNPHIN